MVEIVTRSADDGHLGHAAISMNRMCVGQGGSPHNKLRRPTLLREIRARLRCLGPNQQSSHCCIRKLSPKLFHWEATMRRKGIVAAMNPSRGMVVIATEDDGYTIIELLSDFELEVGDEMTWENGHGLGSETYENVTKGAREEVYVQNHAVTIANLKQQLLF